MQVLFYRTEERFMNPYPLISLSPSKISPQDHDENWLQDASEAYKDSDETSDCGKYLQPCRKNGLYD